MQWSGAVIVLSHRIRAVAEKEARDIHVVASCSKMQWCAPAVVPGCRISPMFEKEAYNIHMSII
jgi:hypothetical protein